MSIEDFKDEEVNLRDYIRVLIKRKSLILGVFFTLTIITAIVSLFLPKVYEASVILMITKPTIGADFTGVASGGRKIETILVPEYSLDTYENLIKNPFLEEKVIKELVKLNPAYSNLTIENLQDMITLKTISNTNLLELKIDADSPQKVVDIANTWATLFTKEAQGLTEIQQTGEFIASHLTFAKENLSKAEETLRQFNETNKIDILQGRVNSYTTQIVNSEKEVSDLITTIKVQEEGLKQLQEQIKSQNEKLVVSKSIIDDQFLHQVTKEITKEEALRLSGLKFTSEELNPVYLNLIQRQMDLLIVIVTNKEKLSQVKQNIETFKKELERFRKELAIEQLKLTRLTREANLSQETFKVLSEKNDELSITTAKQPGTIRIIRLAYPPKYAIKPKKKQNVLVAGVIGLFLGVFIAFFQEYLAAEEKK